MEISFGWLSAMRRTVQRLNKELCVELANLMAIPASQLSGTTAREISCDFQTRNQNARLRNHNRSSKLTRTTDMAIPNRCDNSQTPGDVPLSSLGLGMPDFAALTVARFFFSSFADPKSASWLTAVLSSQDFFPVKNSAAIVQSVLTMVQEIRTSRSSNLRFSNPRCADCASIVTAEERHIVLMLQGAQQKRVSMVATNAMLLCEGQDTKTLIKATNSLVALLDGIGLGAYENAAVSDD